MEKKLKQFLSDNNWVETIDVTINLNDAQSILGNEQKEEIKDDFQKEMLFYAQAQIAAKEALSKLQELGISTARPDDYFAEMVKTDIHMQKIRQKLQHKKESMEKSEKARKQRQLKKIGKKVQEDILKRRQKEKKSLLTNIDKIKKGKLDVGLLDGKDIASFDSDKKQNAMKRKRKDEKFGFGGKKRKVKQNSAGSSNDLSSFRPLVHGKSKNNNKVKAGNNKKRLGKSRRVKTRAGKR